VKIRLVVTVPLSEGETKQYDYVFQQDEITIGRRPGCDIPIPTPEVSDEHAKIVVKNGGYAIVDLGSESGTRLDDTPVPPDEPAELEDGAEIGIGGCTVRVSVESGELTSAVQEKTQQVAMQMVREVLGALGGGGPCPTLEVINDEEQGTTADLPEIGSEVVVGREKECQVRLSHWSVSRRHARFHRTRDGVTVEDLGSKNGVMLNDEVLSKAVKLRDGDIVFVGHTQVRFQDPGDTITDQLIDLPDPVALDIKTSVIDIEEKKAKTRTGEGAKKPEPAPGKKAETPEKKTPPPKPSPEPPTGDAEPTTGPIVTEEDLSGGIGDWLFVIIGIVVILGVAAAAIFLFVL
jgi:pSer/pThr/pTyr-binding forkhead associated (FHA) protein